MTGFQFLRLAPVGEVLSRCIQMFGEPYPRDRGKRTVTLRALQRPGTTRKEWDPFLGLDEDFYKLTGTARFAERADAFVRTNMDLFFRESAG